MKVVLPDSNLTAAAFASSLISGMKRRVRDNATALVVENCYQVNLIAKLKVKKYPRKAKEGKSEQKSARFFYLKSQDVAHFVFKNFVLKISRTATCCVSYSKKKVHMF